ncbi:hypothetical protein [Maricaulis salignorans]|uniref:hypothetical protein n=1 Tax=Maricaulis salignorans TaxID=144026 RepID=UPI003A91984C
MNKFVLAMMAASSLSLLGTAAFAIDHHMAGEAAAPNHEACMALYDGMMADVAEGDRAAHDAVLANLDDATRASFDACHDIIHAEHHPDDAEAETHADHHADEAPATEDMTHGEHEMHETAQPQE